MKSVRYIVLLSLVILLLASCVGLPPLVPDQASSTQGSEEPAAQGNAEQPVATEAAPAARAPAVEATSAITESVVVTATVAVAATGVVTTTTPAKATATSPGEQVMGANPLVDVVWEWAAMLKTKPAVQSVVPDPASYTVVFADDGSMAIKADCNNASGTYTLNNDQLSIQIGGVTRAACPPGSLGDAMLASLGKVASYLIDGGDLILRLSGGDDSMLFRNGGAPAKPAAPPAATEAPAAATPLQTPAAPAETTANPQTLVGPVWQWESYVDTATGSNSMDVKNPENYTVTFMDDGTAAMKADCNQAAGTYTVDGAKLTVEVGPVTLAACGPDSLGETFLINLTSAASYTIADGKLVIDLTADGGRMVFGAAK
jgi:heat shock protein HslJ